MARIEVIIWDDLGNLINEENKRVYHLNLGDQSFTALEGAVESFKHRVLSDIEADLLRAVQKEYREKKKSV